MVILNLWSLAEGFREKNQEILLKPNKPILTQCSISLPHENVKKPLVFWSFQ